MIPKNGQWSPKPLDTDVAFILVNITRRFPWRRPDRGNAGPNRPANPGPGNVCNPFYLRKSLSIAKQEHITKKRWRFDLWFQFKFSQDFEKLSSIMWASNMILIKRFHWKNIYFSCTFSPLWFYYATESRADLLAPNLRCHFC